MERKRLRPRLELESPIPLHTTINLMVITYPPNHTDNSQFIVI